MNQKREHDFDNTMNERTDFGFNDQVGRINFGPGIDRVTSNEAGKYVPKVPDAKKPDDMRYHPLVSDYKPLKITVKRNVIIMSKFKKFLINTAKGKNLLGDIWMVALDLLPGGGALGELIKATAKRADEAGLREAVRERIDRMHWLKFAFTVVVFIAGVYAFIQGDISIADLLVLFHGIG
jgi:hypothetical protein